MDIAGGPAIGPFADIFKAAGKRQARLLWIIRIAVACISVVSTVCLVFVLVTEKSKTCLYAWSQEYGVLIMCQFFLGVCYLYLCWKMMAAQVPGHPSTRVEWVAGWLYDSALFFSGSALIFHIYGHRFSALYPWIARCSTISPLLVFLDYLLSNRRVFHTSVISSIALFTIIPFITAGEMLWDKSIGSRILMAYVLLTDLELILAGPIIGFLVTLLLRKIKLACSHRNQNVSILSKS
jgi:hypothetical protein